MSERREEGRMSIGDAAESAGVSRRTVRYYVQQGLISPPVGKGRASGYTAEHVRQILRIRQLQRDGVELRTIRELEEGRETDRAAVSDPETFPATSVTRIELAPGVRLEIDTARSPPAQPVLLAIREACQRILGTPRKE